MKEQFNAIRQLVACSLCGEKYGHNQAVVLSESESSVTLHLTCKKCNTSTLVFVSNNQQGVLSLGVATDMDGEEAIKLLGGESVSSDDVLDVFDYLHK